MERFVGLDAHSSSCTFTVKHSTGKRLRRDIVETNSRALVKYVWEIPGEVHLCLEEGTLSQWLVDILSPHVAEIVVYRPEWKPGSKSDALDSNALAEMLRTGQVKRRVFKDTSRRFTALRELARTYRMLSGDVVRAKNRLKSFYRGRGIPCAGTAVYSPAHRTKLDRQLPVATRQVVNLIAEELEALKRICADAVEAMLEESHRHKISRILETAPGFGPIRVAQILPIVVTPHRFRTKRPFWKYSGLGIVTRTSSDWVLENDGWKRKKIQQTRGLNLDHNRVLKGIMKGAATSITLQRSGPLREHYDRLLTNGTKPNLAKLTIARQIAAIVLAMWKREEKYDPKKHQLNEAR